MKKLMKLLEIMMSYLLIEKEISDFLKNVNNKLYEIVVKTTQDGKENYLTTFHRCDESKIRKLKKIV